MRKLILPVLLALGLLPLQADEYDYLWVHSPVEADTRSYSIDDLQKITFGEEAMNVYLKNQSQPVSWAYTDWTKLTFENMPTAGVKTPSVSSGLSINPSVFAVRVTSSTPLKSVAIYNMQGSCLAVFGQGEISVSYPVNLLSAGIYIVRAENAKQSKSIKFVKR